MSITSRRVHLPAVGRPALILRLLAVAVIGALTGCSAVNLPATTSPADGASGGAGDGEYAPFAYDPPEAAPPLTLTDQDGRPFSLDALAGRTVLVSFGYTHCPDVCPTTLAIDREVLQARPDRVEVVFVTIDPARDTTTALGAYLAYFGVPMIGLTGTDAEIAASAEAWNVAFQQGPVAEDGSYAMSHTAGTFVVDPSSRLRYLYPYGTPTAVLVAAIDDLDRS